MLLSFPVMSVNLDWREMERWIQDEAISGNLLELKGGKGAYGGKVKLERKTDSLVQIVNTDVETKTMERKCQ